MSRRGRSASSSYSDFEDLDLIRAAVEPGAHATTNTAGSDADKLSSDRLAVVHDSVGTSVKRKAEGPPETGARADEGVRKRSRATTTATSADTGRSPANNVCVGADLPASDLLAARRLGFGIQYVIAGLALSKPDEVSDATIARSLSSLEGSHQSVAPRVRQVLLGQTERPRNGPTAVTHAKDPNEALDMEGRIRSRAQGHVRDVASQPFPGQVQFSGRIVWEHGNRRLRLELLEPELGPSCRFTRCWGSDFLLRVRIHRSVHAGDASRNGVAALREFLLLPIVIFGRHYRFFHANRQTAFFAATNESSPKPEAPRDSDNAAFPSLFDFMMWHNPIWSNASQALSKFCIRTNLGLSNTVLAIFVRGRDIRRIDDYVSKAHTGPGAPPSKMIMTDGCGLINIAGLRAMYELGYWDRIPTAVQVRIGGAKGVLLLDPDHREEREPVVRLRQSQVKINHPDGTTPGAYLEIVRPATMQVGVRIAKEIITNFGEAGVPFQVLHHLLVNQLEGSVDDLVGWENLAVDVCGEHEVDAAMRRLWTAVERRGHVLVSRAARERPGAARARGIRAYDWSEDDRDYDTECTGELPHAPACHPDPISGCPSGLEETVMTMIEGGFTPMDNGVMAEKLQDIAKKAVKASAANFRLIVPMSLHAFIVPDPTGTLEYGQIHVGCSVPSLLQQDGRKVNKLCCEVVVVRSPCKLPTDARKVKAVLSDALEQYPDVIVFSVQGERSLASMLAGGDYDGDRAVVIWDPQIVASYRNASSDIADVPPGFEEENFERTSGTVADLLDSAGEDPRLIVSGIQLAQMRALERPIAWVYSGAHDNSAFKKGYAHPDTIRLARMFSLVLDGEKSGLTARAEVVQRDKKTFKTHLEPPWKLYVEAHRSSSSSLSLPNRRGPELGNFILSTLGADIQASGSIESCREIDRQLSRVDGCFRKLAAGKRSADPSLTRAYEQSNIRAKMLARHGVHKMLAELQLIETHVRETFQTYVKATAHDQTKDAAPSTGDGKHSFTSLTDDRRQAVLRSVSAVFNGFPDDDTAPFELFDREEVARVRASYAYYYAQVTKAPLRPARFPFDVAMRELCLAKSRARQDWRPVMGFIADDMGPRVH